MKLVRRFCMTSWIEVRKIHGGSVGGYVGVEVD